ncbi:MAG: sigma-70 family RNA polymerase sigma factor [Sarcina sp.]
MRTNNSNYINRLKAKKQDALEFIVDKYLPLVKGVTYNVLSSSENKNLIEECINDIFLSVWDNAGKFQGKDDDFKKWICIIAKFKAIDYYRKSSRNLEVAVDEITEGKTISAEDEVIVNEDREEIINLLGCLDDMDREIFIRKFFLAEKSEAIANHFNVTKAVIDNRIYRGKKTLREKRNKIRMEVL